MISIVLGAGCWWALETVTTVGYGDIVPRNTDGRAVGAILMISGIALLSVITAAVTAALVQAGGRRRTAVTAEVTPELVQEVIARLGSIEARLDRVGSGGHGNKTSNVDGPRR